jgi:LysM repeat protein
MSESSSPRRRTVPPTAALVLLFGVILLFAAALFHPLSSWAQSPEPTPRTHTVQAGETLSQIAKSNGTTVSQLMRLNGIPNPDAIYVGRVLRLPEDARPAGSTIHTVAEGETLSEVAARYDVDIRRLMSVNGLTIPDDVYWGQELAIPVGEGAAVDSETNAAGATPSPAVVAPSSVTSLPQPDATLESGLWVHVVKPGETASAIAKRYGVRLADLLAVNGIANANLIRSGAKLVVPGSVSFGDPPSVEAAPAVAISGEPDVSVEPTIEAVATAAPAGQEFSQSPVEGASVDPTTAPTPVPSPTPLGVPTPVPLPGRPAASLNRMYTVVRGDSPQRIALRLGLDLDSLLSLNNLARGDGLVAGQDLLLPATESELSVVGAAKEYVVKPGDSLSGVAKQFDVNLADLMMVNRISNPDTISVGQGLVIPGKLQKGEGPPKRVGPAQSGYYYYTVRPGDTLSELVESLNTTALALMEYNNLPDVSTVYNGMELRVPFGAPPLPRRLPPVPISGSTFLVSLSRQQCWVFSGREVAHAWNCSTGREDRRTKTGNFAVQSKIDNAKSNVWRLDMPYWLGIYDVGKVENGIHGLPVAWDTGRKIWTRLIGQPATFGCAMLDDPDAATLFDLAYLGMPVHIIQ